MSYEEKTIVLSDSSAFCFRFADLDAPLALRAEAMVRVRMKNGRRRRRGDAAWTCQDEALFRNQLADLYTARAQLLRCSG